MTAEERIERGKHASEIEGCTPLHAREVIAQVEVYQRRFRRQHGKTLVFLADEFYLTAGVEPPGAAHYDGFAQYENGIGMTRSLIEDWKKARRRVTGPRTPRRVSFVCGALIAPTLRRLASEIGEVTSASVTVHAIDNRFFGQRVNVSGLLVGGDIEQQLSGRMLGDLAILPRYALDYTGHRFLDDATPQVLQQTLGVPLAFASTLREVLQILGEPLESQLTGAGVSETSTNGKAWVDWTLEAPALGGRGLAKEVRR